MAQRGEKKERAGLSSLDCVLRPQESGVRGRFGDWCQIRRSASVLSSHRAVTRHVRVLAFASSFPASNNGKSAGLILDSLSKSMDLEECARYSNLASLLQIPRLGREATPDRANEIPVGDESTNQMLDISSSPHRKTTTNISDDRF